MSVGGWDFIRFPGSLADGGPDAAEGDGSQVEDRLTAGQAPFHAGLFEALSEQRFAAGFGHAAADRLPATKRGGVVHLRGAVA